MRWTSYFPNSPDSLSRLEWWLWVVAAGVAIFGVLIGVAAREVGRYRATILEQGLAKALEERDAKTKQLERMAGESQAAAEAARREAERLRMRLRPRTVTDDQGKKFLQILAQGSRGSLDFTYPVGDPEAEALANRLEALLKTAGWTTKGSAGVFAVSPVGLVLVVHSPEKAPSDAVVLQKALESIGLPAPGQVNNQQSEGSLTLLVGHKPSK